MPQITDINIKNLRGLEDITLEDARMFNLIVGPSEIGKTTVLEGLFLASAIAYMPGLVTVNKIRGANQSNHENIRSALESLYRNLEANSIDIKLGIKDAAHNIKYSYDTTFTKQYNANEKITTKDGREYSGYENQKKLTRIEAKIEAIGDIIGSAEKELICSGSPNSNEMSHTVKSFDLKKGDVALNEDTITAILPMSYIHNHPLELYDAIRAVVLQKKKEIVLNALKKINPKIEDLGIVGEDLYIDIGLDINMGIHITGSGVREAISTIGNLCAPQINIHLIDEIGKGIYHRSLKGYLKALLHFAKEQNKQIFATTHSKDILIALKKVAEEDESMREEIMCYALARDKYGDVNTYPYDYEEFQSCIDDDMEIR